MIFDEGTLDLSAVTPANIEHMRCAAHTLQLAICDSIKNFRAARVIEKMRNVAKEARTPKLSEIIRKRTNKAVLLNMETRWASTFMMIDSLIQLRPTIKEMAVCCNELLSMSKQQWEQAVELKDLLQKAFEVTKKLQFADCATGYFYRK